MANRSIQCFGFYVSAKWPDLRTSTTLTPVEEAEVRASALFKAAWEANARKDSKAEVTKIFMAPEFFFQDERGATSPEEGAMGAALNAFMTLLGNNQKDFGPNWLFVLGGGNEYTNAGDKDDTGQKITPWNVTPVVSLDDKGGINIRTVLKQYTSHIDYGKDKSHYVLGGKNRPEIAIGKTHTVVPNEDGGGLFKLNGLTIGIEVCLDHAKGILNQPGIPVRLLSSGGMSFDFGKFDKDTLLAFNVDCLRGLKKDAVVLYYADKTGAHKGVPKETVEIKRLSNDALFQGTDESPTLVVYDTVTIDC